MTPRECLSFQGFPSNYIIPKGMADSKIYKQAGNAVSVPVIERIATKIVNTLDENMQEKVNIEIEPNNNINFKIAFA